MKLVKALFLIFILAMMFGCRDERSKIIGTYIYEGKTASGTETEILELNSDGSYRYIYRLTFRPIYNPFSGRHYQQEPIVREESGEWRILKEKGEVGVEFLPFQPFILRKSKFKDYCFYNVTYNRVLAKQKGTKKKIVEESEE
jgi:hypothetical protein